MSGNISAPSKGEPLRANWAADVTAAANRHERLLEAGVAHASPNMRGGSSPFPFMLTGGTDSSGDAQFVIYLPSGSIVYEDSALTPSGITALTGATDRYTLDNVGTIGSTAATASALYLIIYLDTYSAVQSIITTDSSAASTTGNTVLLSVIIGKIFKMTPDTDEVGCVAQQLVRSVIALGQSGGGGGSSSGTTTSLEGNDTENTNDVISGEITVEAFSVTGRQSNVVVWTEDTTPNGGSASGTMHIGAYYV